MNKKTVTLTAVLAGIALAISPALAANATHPQVSGIGTCNPETGLFDVVWTVTTDPGYSATGVFTYADHLADQIVSDTVWSGNGAAITPAPHESVATSDHLELQVGIQFSNHRAGDIVYNTGTVTFLSETCEIPLPENHEVPGDVVDGEYGCDDTTVTTTQLFTLYTYSRDEFGAVVETFTERTEPGVRDLTAEEIAAKDKAPECLPTPTPTPTPPPSLPVTGDDSMNWGLGALAAVLIGALALMWPHFRRAVVAVRANR